MRPSSCHLRLTAPFQIGLPAALRKGMDCDSDLLQLSAATRVSQRHGLYILLDDAIILLPWGLCKLLPDHWWPVLSGPCILKSLVRARTDRKSHNPAASNSQGSA